MEEEIVSSQIDNKILILKNKLEAYGFNEPFNEENYDLINHIINDFNKILFSFKSIKKEKISLEEKNKILENEIETLKQQIKSLQDRNDMQDNLITQVQILSDDKKNLMSEVNKLQQDLSDKDKDKHILELTIEKNKHSIDFLNIEKDNFIEKEDKYKQKISELLKQLTDIKEEKDKYYDLNKTSGKKFDEMEQKMKILDEKNKILEENLSKMEEEGVNMKKMMKEKNKSVKDGEENNNLLRKDLDIMNNKLRDALNENDNIKKINNDLLKDKGELEKELIGTKMKIEELKINKAKIENENQLLNTENQNIKYKNEENEKKLSASNCEIQEMNKTIKYLKKNLEQEKITNGINNRINKAFDNNYCKMYCIHCGCEKKINNTNNSNYFSYNGKEYNIKKLIDDNKTLYKNNKDLKNQINNMALNLDLYINEKNLAANRIFKLENCIKNK